MNTKTDIVNDITKTGWVPMEAAQTAWNAGYMVYYWDSGAWVPVRRDRSTPTWGSWIQYLIEPAFYNDVPRPGMCVNTIPMPARAELIARVAHAGQKREFGPDKGKDYIVHPERVAGAAEVRELGVHGISAAWLHDVLQDTKVTPDLLRWFMIPNEVIQLVLILTKKAGENYLDFIKRCMCIHPARVIKAADITDNMATLDEGSLKDKYRLALELLQH